MFFHRKCHPTHKTVLRAIKKFRYFVADTELAMYLHCDHVRLYNVLTELVASNKIVQHKYYDHMFRAKK